MHVSGAYLHIRTRHLSIIITDNATIFLIRKEKKENNTMLKYSKSSRDHDFLKSSIYPPVIVRGGILRGIERRGLFDSRGGGVILFSEDDGINSRHKKKKTKQQLKSSDS